LFLELHGKGGLVVFKGWGVGFPPFFSSIPPTYSHNTGHWIVIIKHSIINPTIDNLPTVLDFQKK
jgi:hypothetical protein